MEEALTEFTPDVVVYNAGTDILIGDPLGNLSITAQVINCGVFLFFFIDKYLHLECYLKCAAEMNLFIHAIINLFSFWMP